MFKKTLIAAFASFLMLPCAQADENVQALLKKADTYRMAETAMQVETQIVINKNGHQEKDRQYTVMIRENRQSLVIMKSPAEKGQKVLMLGDDFWLIMPNSQRPMRITPTQKLLGDASTGDIATMTWAGDYDGKIVNEEACDDASKARCTHLSLTAQRKGVTYARIELWLAVGSAEPVRCDLFVQSEKLAKQARFVLEKIAGRRQVKEMVLLDQIEKNRETVVRYLDRTPKRAPDEWYNPMFLTRAEL